MGMVKDGPVALEWDDLAWADYAAPYIDNHLYIPYDPLMDTNLDPTNCCPTPVIPMPLPMERHDSAIAVFKALADASRFDIFRLVTAQEAPICVCDVVDRFALSQPTISHHLKVLREAGLIQVSRRGTWAYYAADPNGIATLRVTVGELMPMEGVLT